MSVVLVTGATGFLGGHIVEQLLQQGKTVRVFCRKPNHFLASLPVEIALGDIRDASAIARACQGVQTVHHTAAIAGVWVDKADYESVNVQGTRNVIDACRTYGVSRLVYTSSPSVTFAGDHQRNVDESAAYPTSWLAHYPRTKAQAERDVLASNSKELRTCALRPHLIWGPRDNHLIPRLIQRSRQGKLRIVGNGDNLVDNVYVTNAASAHLLADAALEKGVACGKSYFISQGEPVPLYKWINEILAIAGEPPVKRRISFSTAYFAGALFEGAASLLGLKGEPRMTRFLAAQLAKDHYFNISAARCDLEYAPAVGMQEGMQKLTKWMQETVAK